MVHDNKSPRKPSPVRARATRSSLRYKPTARQALLTTETSPTNQGSCSTIYMLNVPDQRHHGGPLDNHTRLVSGTSSLSGYHGEVKDTAAALRLRSEKLVLDKVEDMDIDHESDSERDWLDCGMKVSASGTQVNSQIPKEYASQIKTERKFKRAIKQVTKASEEKNYTTAKGNKSNPSEHEPKIVKKIPIYIILHAALIRIGDITGKALSPVRIQAEKIILELEVKSGPTPEILKLCIPLKELTTVQTNLFEPPYLLAIHINEKYTQSLQNAGKRNGILKKMQGLNKLKMVIQLTYDSIPRDVKQNLDKLHKDLSPEVQWKEISSSQATDVINGKNTKNCTEEEENEKVQGNQTGSEITTQEAAVKNSPPRPVPKVDESEKSPVRPAKLIPVNENPTASSSTSSESVVKRRRKRAYDERTRPGLDLETDGVKPDEVIKKDEIVEQTEVTAGGNVNGVNGQDETSSTARFIIHSQEQSFEENRLVARRISELEASLAEKTGLLNQRKVSLELKQLQFEQERNTVRELRGSLREEQTMRRELEGRFEVVNSELSSRNSNKPRVEDMERELAQLNISLNDVRTDNQRLVQEIHEVRERMSGSEAALTTERNTIASLEDNLERERTTLETLREELRQKNDELRREQDLRTEAVERCHQLEETLTTTTQDYEQRLRRANDEHTRVGRQYNECNRILESTREELRNTNCALHRAQGTIEEYSRMQPRDWTVLRDEIEISEKVLGQGAWGWVKEGNFRGTKVAVKQMHELIISPHNRRLFEREMQMAARCRHPNLLQFIGATNDNGLALLVTELLDTNLRTVLGQRSLCQDEVLTLSLDVSRALNYLHLNKPFPIIHRDISSTNVLLWKREDTWHAKLSDYGAVNFMRQCMTTSPGALIYAAPEAMTSQQSPKVDVFSFGRLLCEMCIRELPVPSHTNDQIRSITNGHLRDLVQRCTNTTAENRPTMQEVLSALEHLNITLGVVSVNNRQVVL